MIRHRFETGFDEMDFEMDFETGFDEMDFETGFDEMDFETGFEMDFAVISEPLSHRGSEGFANHPFSSENPRSLVVVFSRQTCRRLLLTVEVVFFSCYTLC